MSTTLTIADTNVTLEKLKVTRFASSIIDLHWEFTTDATEPPGFDLALISLDIYRTQAPNEDDLSEYDLIEENFDPTQYTYTDSSLLGLEHGTRTWYYKIKVKEVANPGNFVVSDYTYLNDRVPNRKWLKIYNQKRTGLRKSGRLFMLIKKRSWGERDPETWDPILMTPTGNTSLDDPFGTGWVNGFYKPIPFAAMVTPNPRAKDITLWGEFYPSDIVLSMLNRPPLEPGDVIVDPEKSKRYYVQRTRTLELLGAPIEQQAQLSLIHPSDKIYGYSIEPFVASVTLQDLQPGERFVIYNQTQYVIY